MSLTTFSKFYFGYNIDTTNNLLNFSEGGPELTAELNVGEYSLTDFVAEIQRALNDAGGQAYTVVVDRATRLITVSAASTFSLLVSTGSQIGTSPFSLMGFNGSDRTGTNSYQGDSPSGQEYLPQFILQDHISSDDFQRKSEASINKSASGTVEVISFGIEKFVRFRIVFATNIRQDGFVIKDNPTGVQDLRNFMQSIIDKSPVEFMPDLNSVGTFETLILESTEEDRNGTGYRLKEMYDKGAPGYFDAGVLTFRVV